MHLRLRLSSALPATLQMMAGLCAFAIAAVGNAQTVLPHGDAMAAAMHGMAPATLPLDRKLPPEKLARMLRHGGYVILMRHASSPNTLPDAASADPDNQRGERQLDATGLADARAFGAGLRRLHIPLGAVFTSPTFRARETLREAGITGLQALDFLDIRAIPGQPQTLADIDATRNLLSARPRQGTDTLVVTHFPNITSQFPEEGRSLREGDMLVLAPTHGGVRVVGAMAIGDWSRLGTH